MSFWTELPVPTEKELLVGFYDLTGYGRYAEKTEPRRLLVIMSGYFALTGRILADAGGRLFKTLGDAGLAAFPSELADAGVLAFQTVQRDGDNWLAQNGYKSRAIVKLNLGPVAIGLFGSPGEEILDLYGKTVNVAAALPSTGLAMTAAVFRRLSPVSRKSFKKHTPPISYIDAQNSRPTTMLSTNFA
jgi:class 3 adenylate cyclase